MIDKIPRIGRILFTFSMFRDGFFRKAGVITKVSKGRVYYTDKHTKEECYCKINSVEAVCDTSEEAELLEKFENMVIHEMSNLRELHKRSAERLFDNG